MGDTLPEPTWMRLGFAAAPDENTSGKGVGIVVLDRIRPHATLNHLGQRIRYVIVRDNLSIASRDIAFEPPDPKDGDRGEHGLMSVLLMAHSPFEIEGNEYVGLAPAANFIVLDCGRFRNGERERLSRGIDWVLERRAEWNVKIVLNPGWNLLEPGGWIENTDQKPSVQGLVSALEAGLLVVAANGNTRLENELPPIEYLAVGRFNDRARSDPGCHSPFPDEPWGRNGDGHLRPDLLAPGLYLPIPYCETKETHGMLSHFYGASGASALVVGICAHMLSLYPDLEPEKLRQALIQSADRLPGYENPAARVNVAAAKEAIAKGHEIPRPPALTPPIRVTDPRVSIESDDSIERGLALTMLAKQGGCSRAELWAYARDESPVVRKVAVWALQKPNSLDERKLFWEHLDAEAEGGVRGRWAYGLLQDSSKEEVALWMRWIDDENWAVRWCVGEFLANYPEFPKLGKTFDPESIKEKALPVLRWYEQYKKAAAKGACDR